jgi:CheY-like chemotaxis protein
MDRPDTTPSATPAVPPLASRRILVVEDQRAIRALLEVSLKEAGAEVDTAENGAAALKVLERAMPHVILLDLNMPEMDGWRTLEALQANPRTARIPVVLETSAEDFDSFDRARKQGVAAFISKPFRLSEVVETCRRIFEGSRPLQGRAKQEEELPPVQVRDEGGRVIAIGRLVDLGPRGAQLDLERPLAPGQRVSITLQTPGGVVTRAAEIRWVAPEKTRYYHGLTLKEP